jgi:hypothetical protein
VPLLIIVGGVIGLLLIIAFIQDLRERGRNRQMAKQAEALGFSFSKEGDARLYSQAHRFVLFSQGRTGKMRNLMQGQWTAPGDGVAGKTVDVALFEYTFTTPYGRYTELWRQTVLRIHDEELDLPTFSITPEPIFNAMLENAREPELRERLVGTASLSFKEHPAFEEAMHVQGPDRTAIRPLFSNAVIALYEEAEVLCTEGSGPYLLIYRYDHLIPPKEIPAFVTKARTAYEQIRESAIASRHLTNSENGEE